MNKSIHEDKLITQNKRIKSLYNLEEKFTAGIVLEGKEIKSIRNHKISIDGAYIKISKEKELYVYGINLYDTEKYLSEKKEFKILLKKSEIRKIIQEIKKKKLIGVVTKIFISLNKWAKLEIYLAKRKKKFEIKEKNQKWKTEILE